MLSCYEFVNADSIAAGLSPLQPDKVAFEAGRIMLDRIRKLIAVKKLILLLKPRCLPEAILRY
jgi:predicted ABC-type ATPase